MKRGFVAVLAVVVVAGLVGCGGKSPQDLCKEDVAASCKQMYACNSPVKVGSNEAECTQSLGAFCSLGTSCDNGGTLNTAKAEECTSARNAQTCEQYNAGAPAVCAQRCS